MKLLEDMIQERGIVIDDAILKVDSFINHQIDPLLMDALADNIYEHFKDTKITKIVTIEASGIAPALLCALKFKVPLVFLKKSKPSTLLEDIFTARVHSFTKNEDYIMSGSSSYFNNDDHVLLIDDFLANGEACFGAISILKQAKAKVEGIAILIEKSFQNGRLRLEEENYHVYSLARIKKMQHGMIYFCENDDNA